MYKVRIIRLSLILVFSVFVVNLSFSQLGGPPSSKAEYEKAYKRRIAQEYLNGVYIPKNLTDVFYHLNKLTQEEDIKKFKAATEEEVEVKLFPSLGRWMIHNWGFYSGSRLSHYLKSVGLTHPEDMARFLMVTYHRSLNDKPLDVKPLVLGYIEARNNVALEQFPEKKAIMEANRKTLMKKDSVMNKNR